MSERVNVLLVTNDGNAGGISRIIASQLSNPGHCNYSLVMGSHGPLEGIARDFNCPYSIVNFFASSFNPRPFHDLYREIRSRHPQIIHGHHSRAAFRSRPIARMLGIPHVSTLHSTLSEEIAQRVDLGSIRKKLVLLREEIGFKLDTITIALNPHQMRAFARMGAVDERLRMVSNGVDIARFAPKPARSSIKSGLGMPASALVVGSIGRLAREKNFAALLKYFSKIPETINGVPVFLLMLGDGPEKQELTSLAEQLKISERVRLVGHVQNVEEYLSMIDVLAFCSLYEGQPVAALEAMASGKPIVSTPLSAFDDLLSEGCGVITTDEDYSNALLNLLSSPDMRVSVGARAMSRAHQHYSIDKMLEQLFDAYDAALIHRV